MQSFIIVLRTLIRNSKNTLIKIPLLYNFPLCWLGPTECKLKKKMNLETIELMKMAFLVKNSFVYIVYVYIYFQYYDM